MAEIFGSARCQRVASVAVNCSVLLDDTNTTFLNIGSYGPGGFPGDPDIAGAGVCEQLPRISAGVLIRTSSGYGRVLWAFYLDAHLGASSRAAETPVHMEDS